MNGGNCVSVKPNIKTTTKLDSSRRNARSERKNIPVLVIFNGKKKPREIKEF